MNAPDDSANRGNSGPYELRVDVGSAGGGALSSLQIAGTVFMPVSPFASATIPPCTVTMMSPGCVAAEAAAINVPVLVAVGERDVCPEPHAEPRAYARSNEVLVSVIPRMAHMHNFASTRRLLWSRIEHWARGIAQSTQAAEE